MVATTADAWKPARFATKELSRRTFVDFEAFHNSVHSCGCMLYPRGRHLSPAAVTAEKRAELLGTPDRSKKKFPHHEWQMARNLAEMKELVWAGKAHGILVYADKEPVGWCQYGRAEELPIEQNEKTPPNRIARDPTSAWRITCLTTRRDFRGQGVATRALTAAVEAIRKKGGGWIEATPVAYPYSNREWRKIKRTYGVRSEEMKEYLKTWPEMRIPGVGTVKASLTTSQTADHRGVMAMFERLGFKPTQRDGHGSSPNWWSPYDLVVMRLKV
ncbi:GNAT family N-acetyltransferase [Actinopolymorpha sp. B11F2]|uniref:GNAT family N-acetyltransferase n=1 Tax=Actinopolymorpha sp. B11F2 TaxID=3160862 RepID=UPI0032E3FD11